MSPKSWNGALAVLAALGVGAAVFAFVLRERDRDALVRDRHRAEAALRSEELRRRELGERLARGEAGLELRRRLARVEDELLGEADRLSRALAEKGATESDRRRLEADLAELRRRIEDNRLEMAEAAAAEAQEERRSDELVAENARLKERIAALEDAPAGRPAAGLEATVAVILDEGFRGADDGLRRLGSSPPIVAALDRIAHEGDVRAERALAVLGAVADYSPARLRALVADGAIATEALERAWTAAWLAALRREKADPRLASAGLPTALRELVLDRLVREEGAAPWTLELALELAFANRPGIEALPARRQEIEARLLAELDRALAIPVCRDFLLADPAYLSDLVELAVARPGLATAIREAAAGRWLAGGRGPRPPEETARLAVELGILRDRVVGAGDPTEAAAWREADFLARVRGDLEQLRAGTIDLDDDPEAICLLRPAVFPATEASERRLEAVMRAMTEEALTLALAGCEASRRRRLAALGRGLEIACRGGRSPDPFARALRADGHELVRPFLFARIDRLGLEEAVAVALAFGEHDGGAGRRYLLERLRNDVASRPRLLELLFAAGDEGRAIAWTIADSEDARAVHRLIELALENEVAMPRAAIERILRSSVLDLERRDVAMAVFRGSLGDDFREVVHEALVDPRSARKDVLLLDFALPPDENLLPVVLRFLDDENPRLRESALRVLHDYEVAGLVDRLAVFVRDEDAMVRVQLARCLGEVDDEVARGLLMTLTRDLSFFVREAATISLARQEGDRVRPFLRERLADGAPEVRIAAAWALLNRGEADVVAPLIEMIAEPGLGPLVEARLETTFGRSFPDRTSWQAWWESEGKLGW